MRSKPSDVGTEDDFARFFESERTSAMRLAWLLTRDERTAEDVMQEAFTAVYPRFDNLHQPAAYLRRAVVNAVFERSRRAGREHDESRSSTPANATTSRARPEASPTQSLHFRSSNARPSCCGTGATSTSPKSLV